MVLAVGGETLWHVQSALAASSRGGAQFTTAAALAGRRALFTTPDFKPFALVPLAPPSGWSVVEGTQVRMNESGNLVATFEDGSGNKRMFVWWDEGHDDGSTVTGGWQGPIKDASNNPIVMDSFGATGINSSDEICGTLDDGDPIAFFFEFTDLEALKGSVSSIGTGYATDTNDAGLVVGTSIGGVPVAWSQAYLNPVPLTPLSGSAGTAAHGVQPDGGLSPFIAGQSQDGDAVVQGVVWYSSSGWQVVDLTGLDHQDDAIGIATAVNNLGHVVGASRDDTTFDVIETLLWTYSSGSWTSHVIDSSHSDFVPNAISDDNSEVVGSHFLWVPTNLSSGQGDVLDLLEMTIGVPDDCTGLLAWDINAAGEVCGVMELDDEDTPYLPFKIVPFDTDNNGTPDYREIAADPSPYILDGDGNWLLDESEDMRVGLYATSNDGVDSKALEVLYTQVVRLHIHEPMLDSIVNTPSTCENQQDYLEEWMEGGSNGQPKEIMATIRCDDSQQDGYDRIYTASTSPTKEEFLDNLFAFAYRYAYSIDYIQLGNEIFSGPGEYYMYDLSGCDDGPVSELEGACYSEAWADMSEWIEEQVEVVRMGSALAGRPLRIISPSFTAGYAITGQNQDLRDPGLDALDEKAAFAIDSIVDLANKHQMWTDMHLHYRTNTQLEDALDALNDPGQYSFTKPDFQTCTEWSPIPRESWVDDNSAEYAKYFISTTPPADVWDDFVVAWGTDEDELNRDPFPDFESDLTNMESYGLLMACYGEFWQGSNAPDPPTAFDLTVVRANQVIADPDWIDDYTNLWTHLRTDLQGAADDVFISGFDPHPTTPTVDCDTVVPRP